MSWQAALAYCEGLNWGGWTDWYLPNAIELRSIVNDLRNNPAIDTTAFPAAPTTRFWSSSSDSDSSSNAWLVVFSDGSVIANRDKLNSHDVRCIRRGP